MWEAKWAAIALMAAGLCMAHSSAHAKAEVEPNNSCVSSQAIGTFPPAPVKGTIVEGDSDYFLLKAPAGTYLTLEVQGAASGKGTLQAPVIGAYDSSCALLGGVKYGSKETVVVPADGLLIIEVGDEYYSSLGNPIYLGSYVLAISAPTSLIFGTVTDPQTGSAAPSTYPRLNRCASTDYQLCVNYSLSSFLDASGRYVLDTSNLEPGRYQVWISTGAPNVATQYSDPLDLNGEQSIQLDFQTKPTPIEITPISMCASGLPAGSDCEITYKIRNTTADVQEIELRANVLSITDASVFSSTYDVGKNGVLSPINKTLQPGQTLKISQTIPIAADLPTGSSGSVTVYAYARGMPQTAIGRVSLGRYMISAHNTATTTLLLLDQTKQPAPNFLGGPSWQLQPPPRHPSLQP